MSQLINADSNDSQRRREEAELILHNQDLARTTPPDFNSAPTAFGLDHRVKTQRRGSRSDAMEPTDMHAPPSHDAASQYPSLPPSPRLHPTSPSCAGIAGASTISSLAASPSLGSNRSMNSEIPLAAVSDLQATGIDSARDLQRQPSISSLEGPSERAGSIGAVARTFAPLHLDSHRQKDQGDASGLCRIPTTAQLAMSTTTGGDDRDKAGRRTRSTTTSTQSDAGLPEAGEHFPILQMLSMVGSRFVEAEADGFPEPDQGVQHDSAATRLEGTSVYGAQSDAEESNDDEHMAKLSAAGPSQPATANVGLLRRRVKRVHGSRSEIWDDTPTPVGSRTPLAASYSAHAAHEARGSHSATRPSTANRSSRLARGQSSDREADGDAEESNESDLAASTESLAAAGLAPQASKDRAMASDLSSSTESKPPDLSTSLHMLSSAVLDRSRPDCHSDSDPDPESSQPHRLATSTADTPLLSADERKQLLAAKLVEIFGLGRTETLLATHQAFLVRGLLLSGHIYLTSDHLLFYAPLPTTQHSSEGDVLQAGALRKKTRRTMRFSKHWAVLGKRALSWYDSHHSPYFPQDHIDLRDIIEIGSSQHGGDLQSADDAQPSRTADAATDHASLDFYVQTSYRRFVFSAASQASKATWVGALRSAVMRAQNDGDSVRLSIPLETIVDVEYGGQTGVGPSTSEIAAMPSDFSSSQAASKVPSRDFLCIKVIDGAGEDFAIHEYFFRHKGEPSNLVEVLSDTIEHHNARPRMERRTSSGSVRDTLAGSWQGRTDVGSNRYSSGRGVEFSASSAPIAESAPAETNAPMATEMLGPRAIPIPPRATGENSTLPDRDASSETTLPMSQARLSETPRPPNPLAAGTHRYPPASVAGGPPRSLSSSRGARSSLDSTRMLRPHIFPGWMREAGERLLSVTGPGAERLSAQLAALARQPHRKVQESWSRPLYEADFGFRDWVGASQAPDGSEPGDPMWPGNDCDAVRAVESSLDSSVSSNYSLLEGHADQALLAEEADRDHQFRTSFILPKEEALVYHVSASLYRIVPVQGRVFISTRYVCFRSSRMATKAVGRTLMVLPISELVSVAKHNAFRFGQHGLVLMVRGHEELFLEFGSRERRDECMAQIDYRVEELANDVNRVEQGLASVSDNATKEALMLRDLSQRISIRQGNSSAPTLSGSLDTTSKPPDVPFPPTSHSSASSYPSTSMQSFDPAKSLHFTFLTIGSRGDVQPFIALGQGLKDAGHRVRIATHLEFKAWIESHGIEFREVGGDPAELMRICVENGTFTVSFLREGVSKFRGWLDDLLKSSWEACQGTDVVIESPSAIAGIHIAEALQKPYYRAFTMIWSRTRAYPHAFAVPTTRAGGNYNYMTYVVFDQVFWRASAGQINAWRKTCLGLQPTSLDRLEPHRVPFLYNFSPSVVPKPLDWYEWIDVTGYWFLRRPDGDQSWTPPDDLAAFMKRAKAASRKLVYIGWGSIVVRDAQAMTRCVYEAVRQAGVCAILSKGWSDRLSDRHLQPTEQMRPQPSSPISEDVFEVRSIPHDWLFPQIDAACHHGGAGTTGASLRAGIPTIVKPYFGDQFFWGAQLEALGVGSCVRELTAENLAAALVKATQSPRQIERAKALGEQIRKEDGVKNAIAAIFHHLDYATSLIKLNTRLPGAVEVATKQPIDQQHSRPDPQPDNEQPAHNLEPALSTTSGSGDMSRSDNLPPRTTTAEPDMQGSIASINSGMQTSDAEWSVVSDADEFAASQSS
ncbi:hypothetical protein IE81DRAFT_314651 [Ceraceosorus guamensis]|uniref:sterol 3beta-glucosyltransferase n=1 Tax=Ceraceosorus guamensis TaxID=1522189 RepID=A0A316VW01_9BASI|nr:hypothetical protein IE81DRAFT_314651 [Ceraceosorus guamensis]PWN41827.1 hypothetical protein IE81DRAFT_314651 [Ceraceosorus guamensis]